MNTTLVGVFPGSRYMEVTRTLPDIGLALQALRSQLHGLRTLSPNEHRHLHTWTNRHTKRITWLTPIDALVVTRDPVKADVQDVLFKEWQDIPFTLVDRAHATPFMKVRTRVSVCARAVTRCEVAKWLLVSVRVHDWHRYAKQRWRSRDRFYWTSRGVRSP